MKDGLSEVAWSKLIERHSSEKDPRVVEAYKVSKVKIMISSSVTLHEESALQ